ncbi:MAG: S41 family peptidase [Fibrobacterales bacterium]
MILKSLVGGIVLLALTQCSLVTDNDDTNTAQSRLLSDISQVMSRYYLWYDKIEWVDRSDYYDSDPQEYVNALAYNDPGPDKWSFILDIDTYTEHYINGEGVGLGIDFMRVSSDYLVFSQVFEESKIAEAGIHRGDTLVSLNGNDVKELIREGGFGNEYGPDEVGYSIEFEVHTSSGKVIKKVFSKENLLIPVIPLATVIEKEHHTVGYMLYNSFMDFSIPHLDTVFEFFHTEGVTELVIDLRYNGGGSLDVASYIASYLLPSNYQDASFSLYANDKNSDIDTTYSIEPHNNTLAPKKVIVITSGRTASASEYLIMTLKDHIDLTVVGQQTAGKPVGMYSFDLKSHMFFPISFIGGTNGEQWDFFGGIDESVTARDDLLHELGAEDEGVFAAALESLSGESTSLLIKRSIEQPIPQNFASPFHSIRGFH